MRIGSWTFKPGLWPTLGFFCLLPLLLKLGFWQLDRANEKIELFESFQERQSQAVKVFSAATEFDTPKEEMYWRSYLLRGSFVSEPQFLLDNQVENTVAGYFIFSLFKPLGSEKLLLVNRGWLPVGTSRTVLPDVIVSEEETDLLVEAKPLPFSGVSFIDVVPEKLEEHYRLQRVEIEQLEEIVNNQIKPLSFRLKPESTNGYIRNWKVPGSTHAKHHGYAFQWFAMAFVLSLIYLMLNTKRMNNE